jgi:hypothetical protein
MSELSIVLQREVPPAIVKLVHREFSPHPCVRQVLITGDCKDLLEGHMAAFVPATGSVVIDLDACVRDLRWMDKGATFIANAWFNVLYCIFHEANHAWQVEIGVETDDESSDEYALESMFHWSEHNSLPRLEEMEYLGERIKVVLNAMWAKHASVVENEISACGIAAADAGLAIRKSRFFEKEQQVTALLTEVVEGKAGCILNGRAYLRADEFLAIDDEIDANPDDIHSVLVEVFAERINHIRKGESVYA